MTTSARWTDGQPHPTSAQGKWTAANHVELAGHRRRRAQLLVSILLVGGLCPLLAVAEEQVDSGWAVARPLTADSPQMPVEPGRRLLLEHILDQTTVPMSASPRTGQRQEGQSVRVAGRVNGSDGWQTFNAAGGADRRPLNQHVWPPGLDAALRVAPDPPSPPPSTADASSLPSLQLRVLRSGPATPDADLADDDDELVDGELAEGELAGDDSETQPSQSDSLSGDLSAHELVESQGADDEVTDEALVEDDPQDAPTAAPPTVAPPPPPPLTRQLLNLRSRVRSVLRGYYQKSLNSRENDPWEAMHGMLAYGVLSRIRQGSPRGEHITAVGWLCYNRPCKGQTLLYVTPEGELRAKYGVGLQGHMGQLLAMLAQSHVSPDYPIRVGGHEFTVRDLIEAEKKTCYADSELTFKLIALSHYLDLDTTWINDQGADWDVPRLIREELAQPIRGVACGGTHRLAGLSLAVKARERRGQPIDGEYARAAKFVRDYQNYALRLQNRDGSLSTEWFRGRGDDSDLDRRVKTTGHILEWLVYSFSDEELRDPRTVRAVTYLTNLLYSNYNRDWEVGPVSHATHALLLYDQRVFQPLDAEGEGVTVMLSRMNGVSPQANVRRR